MDVRFSRHAKNKIRLHQLTQQQLVDAIHYGTREDQGDRVESRLGNVRVIWLMVGSFALVVTVIKTRQE